MLPSAGLWLALLVAVVMSDIIPDDGEGGWRAGEETGLTSVVMMLLDEWSP